MTLVDRIRALLTPEAVAALKPHARVELVRLVSGRVFTGQDYETHELISEAMGPYTEDIMEDEDPDEDGDEEEDGEEDQ